MCETNNDRLLLLGRCGQFYGLNSTYQSWFTMNTDKYRII